MPGPIGALEYQTVVADGLGRYLGNKVLVGWRGAKVEFASIIEYQRIPAPGRIPLALCIEIEKMRPVLTLGVGMGRYGAPVRCVMPVKAEFDLVCAHEAGHRPTVTIAPKLVDKILPRLRDLYVRSPFQRIPIVGVLAAKPSIPEDLLEQGDVGHVVQQRPVSGIGQ
jgi:hypothetical protein